MLGCDLEIDGYLDRLKTVLKALNTDAVKRLADQLYERWQSSQFIFIVGNGGSATTASHLAEDLGKTCAPQNPNDSHGTRRLKVMSLTDNIGWVTALANDIGYESIFSEQLKHYASSGDLLIAISGSGNSPNVLRAVEWASSQDVMTFALTGYDGGKLREIADDCIHLPLPDMGMVETVHLALGHWLVDDLAARINCSGRYQSGITVDAS